MINKSKNENLGAIVCGHVARGGLPILGAIRDEPQDPGDSGWQFMCYSGQEESIADAQIWSIQQVLELEPSLRPFVDLTTGTRIERASVADEWKPQ